MNPLAWLGKSLRCKHGAWSAPDQPFARLAFEALETLHILRPTSNAAAASCPLCDVRHLERVEQVDYGPEARYFIYCPRHLRVAIDPVTLCRWLPSFSKLAALVRDALALTGQPYTVVPDGVYRLGYCRWGGSRREVFLVLCAHAWSRLSGPSHCPIIFTLCQPLQAKGHPTEPAGTVWLADVCSVEAGQLVFDATLLLELIGEQAPGAGNDIDRSVRATIDRYARQAVDRVESEGTTHQLMLALARQGLSTRKIEQAMRQRGFRISHSTVARHIKHLKHQLMAASSASVIRDQLFQPRDRKDKPLGNAQPEPQ